MRETTIGNATLYQGDCLEVLRNLEGGSVQCCVTSPPYYGLRSYLPDGHADKPLEIGLDPTPDEYVAKLVAVFREVRRVLREDGTLWLNLGQSYSNAVPNMTDCVNRVLEGCSVFGFDAETIASPAKSVDVSAHDQRTPDGELTSLLGAEWESVEKRDNDFCEVVDCLAIPRDGRAGVDSAGLMFGGATASDAAQNMVNGAGVVFADLNANLQAKLTVLGPSGARSGHGNDAPLSVKEPSEPRAKSRIGWHPTWDSFAVASLGKCVPNVYLMNQAVALRNGALSFACLLRDFKVTHASDQKITFTSIGGGIQLVVSNVGHLIFSFADGSIVPYRTIYDKAVKMSNKYCAKQEIDTPNMVKTALQEDGWICRQTIIWHKKSPMPESVTDRCTKAHEYVFLLSKSARYYYDAEAIAEPSIKGSAGSRFDAGKTALHGLGRSSEKDRIERDSRNRRSVWTIATKPYSGAHFAVMPPALVEPCILAGSRPGDVCLDPFSGSGTVAAVAASLGRQAIGIELNPEYQSLAIERIEDAQRQPDLLWRAAA